MDARVVELGETSRELFSLTARLSLCAGPASLQADLVASIRELLQQFHRDLCYAESFVEDVDNIDERDAMRLTIARLRCDHGTHQRLYRRALFRAQENLKHDRKRQVTALAMTGDSPVDATVKKNVGGLKVVKSKREGNARSAAVLQASSDVTAGLRKTHALMSEELSRTALSQELLDESSATLERLNEEYTTFGTILIGSKRLLKELENADRIDQLWIWGSFGFFCLVVAFILYRRILSRPVNALIWTGSFMFSRVSQRKILERHVAQKQHTQSSSWVDTQATETATTTIKVAEESTSLTDEILDMVFPELVREEDDVAARIARARSNPENWQREEPFHAEL